MSLWDIMHQIQGDNVPRISLELSMNRIHVSNLEGVARRERKELVPSVYEDFLVIYMYMYSLV